MITVGRVHDKDAIDVSRNTPLGNPYLVTHDCQREWAIGQYEKWLREKLRNTDPQVTFAFYCLVEQAKHMDVVLGCHCSPKPCHADVIKKLIEERLNG